MANQTQGELLSGDPPLVSLQSFLGWIIHEDNDVIVLNKPGWLVCHPSKNGPWSSLVGAVKEYLGVDSVHLASRLDRETSGVVLFAKHKAAASYWQKGVEEKYVQRAYLAVLRGEISNDQVIHTYLGNDPHSKVFVKQRVTEKSGRAKQAETIFYPLIYSNGYTFCRVLTKTGRKHQIRVHAQWAGHPLVGEKLYGSDEQIYLKFCTEGWQEEWRDLLGMSRQALHGRSLYDHRTGKTFQAPLASDIVDFIQTNLGVSNKTVEQAVRRVDHHFLMTTHKN